MRTNEKFVTRRFCVFAILTIALAAPCSLDAQIVGPGPTFPRTVPPSARISDSAAAYDAITMLLSRAQGGLVLSVQAHSVWPDALKPELDCASSTSEVAILRPDTVKYRFVTNKLIVDHSGSWATEIGTLSILGVAAPPNAKHASAHYLRVWKRRGASWTVTAVCSELSRGAVLSEQ